MTPEEFVALRLEKAMKGWGTSEGILIRLLGGLDHSSRPSMPAVVAAYQRKYRRRAEREARSGRVLLARGRRPRSYCFRSEPEPA